MLTATIIGDVTLASLREQVGIVPQETNLFNDTVYNNILYGRLDATRDEVIAAAKAANADEFIQQLPKGYDTQLGDRGVNISAASASAFPLPGPSSRTPRILILTKQQVPLTRKVNASSRRPWTA